MNTKISFTMKTFFCIAAFALTTIFSFANEKSKINKHNITSYSQFKKLNDLVIFDTLFNI
jgi:hypothetical protein